jgi:SRSO17 transposase
MAAQADAAVWETAFQEFHARFASFFYRAEVRQRSARYLRSLLGPVERKNGWQLAAAIGEADPNGAQRLLYEARWDEDAVRDELERFVAGYLGDPTGILVVDETGFLKQGSKSVGVKRQYSGTAGKIENCQIGVFLAYRSSRGYALLDRRLYLPQEWAQDAGRRKAAGVPETVTFATKPELAQAMLAAAWKLGAPGRWVTGDAVYGSDPGFRRAVEAHRWGYVLAVRKTEPLWQAGTEGVRLTPVALTAAGLAATAWQRLSAGDGAKGPRLYDWAWVETALLPPEGWTYGLLVRRSLSDPMDLAYYAVFAPAGTTLAELVRVAGARWVIEQGFAEAKGETGLDQYEVRSWRSWHRHITLSLLASAFLGWVRQRAQEQEAAPAGEKTGTAAAAPAAADHSRGATAVAGVPAAGARLP